MFPFFARRFALSLALLAVVATTWIADAGAWVDELWWFGLAGIPTLDALIFLSLFECLSWSLQRQGNRRRPVSWLPGGVICLAIVWLPTRMFVAEWPLYDPDVHAALLVTMALVVASPEIVLLGCTLRRRSSTVALRFLIVSPLALALLAGSTAIWRASNPPVQPDPTPLAIAHEIREDLRTLYPHWHKEPQSLDALWRAYLPALRDAARDCPAESEFCRPLFRELRALLAELNNGHTGIVIPDEIGVPPVTLQKVEDGTAISWVDPEFQNSSCNLTAGTQVLAVNGLGIDEAVLEVPSWRVAQSRPGLRDYASHEEVLTGVPSTQVTLSVRNAGGEPCDVVLTRESIADLWEERHGDDYEYFVDSEVLAGNVAYLVVEGFGGSRFERRMGDALDRVMHTTGLILDLRGNGGGTVAMAERLTGRFFSTQTRLGDNCQRLCERRKCSDECEERRIDPVDPGYTGRVAVLIDEYVASAAESVAYGLCRVGPARCFDRATSGNTDFVITKEFWGAHVSISSARFHPSRGPQIQGHGLVPDEVVPLYLEDLRSGNDPVLDAAREWIAGEAFAKKMETHR